MPILDMSRSFYVDSLITKKPPPIQPARPTAIFASPSDVRSFHLHSTNDRSATAILSLYSTPVPTTPTALTPGSGGGGGFQHVHSQNHHHHHHHQPFNVHPHHHFGCDSMTDLGSFQTHLTRSASGGPKTTTNTTTTDLVAAFYASASCPLCIPRTPCSSGPPSGALLPPSLTCAPTSTGLTHLSASKLSSLVNGPSLTTTTTTLPPPLRSLHSNHSQFLSSQYPKTESSDSPGLTIQKPLGSSNKPVSNIFLQKDRSPPPSSIKRKESPSPPPPKTPPSPYNATSPTDQRKLTYLNMGKY